MKILYIHGYGAHWDPEHEKIQALSDIGTVVGTDVNYCKGHDSAFNVVGSAIEREQPDLVIGTGIGGHVVAYAATKAKLPFVALNPIIQPSECMKKWVGGFTDSRGDDLFLPDGIVSNWPDIITDGRGLILVETADEITGAVATREMLEDHYEFHSFNGGNHGFRHIERALPIIQDFYSRAMRESTVDKEHEDL